MAALSNPKREKFAQGLAKGLNASEAMREAGYGDVRNSSRLTNNDEIMRRVDELRSRAVENVMITREWIIEQLVDNARRARDAGDFGPSNKAFELLGKEIGMFVERTENININHDVTDEPLSDEEWASQHVTEH
jgi:phage terminase small subunit